MFFLNKEAASGTVLSASLIREELVWRYVPKSKYVKAQNGHLRAKSEAFSIRRDAEGNKKEPSASLFQLKESNDHSLVLAIRFLDLFVSEKKFKIKEADATGAILTSSVAEMTKDPKFFSLLVSGKQDARSEMLHWDLTYEDDDDCTQAMQNARNALCLICRLYSPVMQVPVC